MSFKFLQIHECVVKIMHSIVDFKIIPFSNQIELIYHVDDDKCIDSIEKKQKFVKELHKDLEGGN